MAEPEIIYEDENFLAVNKPAGLVVHAAAISGKKIPFSDKEKTLADWLLRKYPAIRTVGDDPQTRPGIVHRLDKDASGVMLVAKNQRTFEYLKSLFQNRNIRKTYLALVSGKIKERSGAIEKPIGIRNGTLKRSVSSEKMSKLAVTEYKLLRYAGENSLVEVHPKTGRTHQIRVHMASIGHPIVGDPLYGPKKSARGRPLASRLMLHALSLEFSAEDGTRMKIETEPPEEFNAA